MVTTSKKAIKINNCRPRFPLPVSSIIRLWNAKLGCTAVVSRRTVHWVLVLPLSHELALQLACLWSCTAESRISLQNFYVMEHKEGLQLVHLQASHRCSFVVVVLVARVIQMMLRLLTFPLWRDLILTELAMKCLNCHMTSTLILQCGMPAADQSSAAVVILFLNNALNMKERSGLTWETWCCIRGSIPLQYSSVMVATGSLDHTCKNYWILVWLGLGWAVGVSLTDYSCIYDEGFRWKFSSSTLKLGFLHSPYFWVERTAKT